MIKVKVGGSYQNVVGISVKRSGAYQAVADVLAKAGGAYGSILGPTVNQNLPFFSAALAARRADRANVRQARIVTLGHSWTGGAGSGTSDGRSPGAEDIYGLIGSIPLSWSEKLCQYLTARGIKTMRNGWMGDQRGPVGAYGLKDMDPGRHVYDSAQVTEGTVSNFMGAHPKVLMPGAIYEFTPGFAFTSFKLWGSWSATVYSNDIELFVDDVSKIHITADTGGNKWGSFPIAGGTYNYPGTKITLTNHHATKKFNLNGIECFGPTTDECDVFLTMAGRGGSTLADLVLDGSQNFALNAVPVYGCDLLFVQAIVNDANGASTTYAGNGGNETVLQTTLNTWKSNIQKLYDKNPTADIVLIGDPDAPTGAATEYIITRFHQAAQEIIAANGRGLFLDLRVPYGTYANSNALGYRHTGDTMHPSALGHDVIGAYAAQVMTT